MGGGCVWDKPLREGSADKRHRPRCEAYNVLRYRLAIGFSRPGTEKTDFLHKPPKGWTGSKNGKNDGGLRSGTMYGRLANRRTGPQRGGSLLNYLNSNRALDG